MSSTAARKRANIGFDYIQLLVDDHTRLAYSEVLPDEKGATCAGFLLRAAANFAVHGITRIERVMTDTNPATSSPPTSPPQWLGREPSTCHRVLLRPA